MAHGTRSEHEQLNRKSETKLDKLLHLIVWGSWLHQNTEPLTDLKFFRSSIKELYRWLYKMAPSLQYGTYSTVHKYWLLISRNLRQYARHFGMRHWESAKNRVRHATIQFPSCHCIGIRDTNTLRYRSLGLNFGMRHGKEGPCFGVTDVGLHTLYISDTILNYSSCYFFLLTLQ